MGLSSTGVSITDQKNGRTIFILLFLTIILTTLWLLSAAETAASAPESTLLVNTADDTDDGTCDAAHCSLREAITAANNLPGADTIQFTIPASATIQLTDHTQLPAITDTLTLDGTGQIVKVFGNARVIEVSLGTTVTMTHLVISNGYLVDESGAGILNQGDLTIIESTLTGNDSDGYDGRGGGIYNESGRLTLLRSTFYNNASGFGAASIWNDTGTVFVENSTFTSNDTHSGIGGIVNYAGTLTVNHSTFADNSSVGNEDFDIYVFDTGTLALSNSILASGCENMGTYTLNVNNHIIWGQCLAQFSGDPRLGPLMNYGGPTRTIPLYLGSEAIDNADPAYCPATDQRGMPRPAGAGCDIGAFEGYFSPTAVSLTGIDSVNKPFNRVWLLGMITAVFPVFYIRRQQLKRKR